VTVGRFTTSVEAQMARGMLEAAGVECFMVGENVSSILPMTFRVRLQVRLENEDAALEMLTGVAEAGDA
jgi:hypothetical protein